MGSPKSDWFSGPFRVLFGVTELSGTALGRGDIIRHNSGVIVLRCPKCGAMQFGVAKILNSDTAPTFDRPIQCGSGHCERCGVWFTVKNGRAEPAEAQEKKKVEIPEKLAAAGVGPSKVQRAPKVQPEFRLRDLKRK